MKREALKRAVFLESEISDCDIFISQCKNDERFVCLCRDCGMGYSAQSRLPNQGDIKNYIIRMMEQRKLDLEVELFKLLNS